MRIKSKQNYTENTSNNSKLSIFRKDLFLDYNLLNKIVACGIILIPNTVIASQTIIQIINFITLRHTFLIYYSTIIRALST